MEFSNRDKCKEDRTMPDPTARKRLKKKMLDRWENEGGSIGADTTSEDSSKPTSAVKGYGKKLSSSRDHSSVDAPASPTKSRKANRK